MSLDKMRDTPFHLQTHGSASGRDWNTASELPRVDLTDTMASAKGDRTIHDGEGRKIVPMSLGKMRALGVRSVSATCKAVGCGYVALVNVDHLADGLAVPQAGLHMVCRQCGGREIHTRPNWYEHRPFTAPMI